ncbi:MAG: hypothetical protein IJY18_02465 [Clostridia bacterium]|nr:hypothetical protein [Clostridia bacterium]
MIVVKKKMKKPLIIAILAGILAVATVAAILLNTLLLKDDGSSDSGKKDKVQFDASLGESEHNGSAVAFPHVPEERMESIEIKGDRTYSFTRVGEILDLGEDEDLPPFILSYKDENGVEQVYAPEIMAEDPTYVYEDSYAFTEDASLGSTVAIYKITWLCTAIGTSYFEERIPVSENLDKRDEELKVFGLSRDDSPIEISYFYYDEEGELQINQIKIGDKIIHGEGYYFTVANRPYVYSTTNPYLEYAFLSFTDYIEPLLVSKGLPQDKAFEPYLTTDFKQWKNTMYSKEGDAVKDGSTVAFTADKYLSAFTVNKDGEVVYNNNVSKNESIILDLDDLYLNSSYERFAKVLRSAKVGKLSDPIAASVFSFSTPVTLDASGVSKKYTYVIKSIDAVITDTEEISEEGFAVGDNDLIKITYAWYIDGKQIALSDFSGIIDLSSPAIPDAAEAALRQGSVGTLEAGEYVDLNIVYNKSNTMHHEVSIVITEIIEILDADDKKIDKVTDGATVLFRYNVIANGKEDEKGLTSYVTIRDAMAEDEKAIAKILKDKPVGDVEDGEVSVYSIDCEAIAGYTTYVISSVEYFYTSEMIVSFEFVQASERDPYFGESLYKNTMDGALYALNASSCQAVVRLLGGLNESATSSLGLKGTKTIDIGITPAKIQKYGLYANTIYFELPRGISAIDYGDTPTDSFFAHLDDYSYYDTLGFTLYISDPGIDGMRYIASDLYDVISKVSAEDFVFLDESFESFYARRNLVMVDVSAMEELNFEFTMDDVYGKYKNDLTHTEDLYAYGGKLWHVSELTEEELSMATKYDAINVLVTPSGDCINTKFGEYLEKNNKTYDSLYNFFGKERVDLDALGTSNFKELIEALFYTHYQGFLSEEEQAAGFALGKKLMKMTVALYDDYGPYRYVYEFYKISDRRIMVEVYREHTADGSKYGVASSFYVSTYAFEKIVGLYFDLLNGENIENETPYVDIKQ